MEGSAHGVSQACNYGDRAGGDLPKGSAIQARSTQEGEREVWRTVPGCTYT